MAVTITVADIAQAARIGDSDAETAEITRLRAYAIAEIARHLGGAYATTADVVVDEACIRLCGFLYDCPTAPGSARYANALRNSGAARMLLPYRVHRAGAVKVTRPDDSGSPDAAASNPVVDVEIANDMLTVTYSDGSTAVFDLPAGGGGGAGPTLPRLRSAISDDTALTAAEVAAGTSSDSASITTPTWTGGVRYVFVGVPLAAHNITAITQGGFNVFGGFERSNDESDYKWWRTSAPQNVLGSGLVYGVVQ